MSMAQLSYLRSGIDWRMRSRPTLDGVGVTYLACNRRRLLFRPIVPNDTLPSDLAAPHSMIFAERAASLTAKT
jgi:hypothetical protein